MNTKFYADKFFTIKKFIKKLLIFEIIFMLLFSTIFKLTNDDIIKMISILYIGISILKIFYLHHIKQFAYYYEYDLETGQDLYAD